MARLAELKSGARIAGLSPAGPCTVVHVAPIGAEAVEISWREPSGAIVQRILFAADAGSLTVAAEGRAWSFAGEGDAFKLALEATRIRLAHLFDPYLAVTTSLIEPLPHQITAVYGELLPRQPLRFLLADDPGAGKTIMAGLLIKELIVRGDLKRCLIVAPGSLVEQWQDELLEKFGLDFELLSRERVETSRTGNPFLEADRWIVRLDQLSRADDLQEKLEAAPEFDLVVCDEAHRMAASYFASEVRYTKRYLLGQLLGRHCRNLLLMTATPHNGKEADFQLFMALLDGDRFEGKFRDGVHMADPSDLMRRLIKEELLKFDGSKLFPERHAYTVKYDLSPGESALYAAVTDYVRNEMNRAEALADGEERRRQNVGFALQILQRRLASSPAAIHESLKRRLARLEERLAEASLARRGAGILPIGPSELAVAAEDFEEAAETEVEAVEEALVGGASAARTSAELAAEIAILRDLERQARELRRSGQDTKWRELQEVLDRPEMTNEAGTRRKLIVFTEPRDTLEYLAERIRARLGRPEAVVIIHGGIGREERRKTVEAFRNDPEVLVLVANDACGEGVNLQRAHLMVNYDLPWNPNRIEQRFGRIHRIGQTEVCHLWNLVAHETREGQVYARLLEKLDTARAALGGRVFDVLGRLFEARPLRDLLVDAIRYGDDPIRKQELLEIVEGAVDQAHLRELLDERALVDDTMDASRVRAIREDMERANAQRLQPFYIEGFFMEAFAGLGGQVQRRETGRFEVSRVPASVRARDRQIGTRETVLPRYERICFEKERIGGPPAAAFVCPGHPLLDAVVDIVRELHGPILGTGAILVAPDSDITPRLLLCLRHGIVDGHTVADGRQRVVSERMQFVEIGEDGAARSAGPAPHVDYRAASEAERALIAPLLDAPWLRDDPEQRARRFAIAELVPRHLDEVSSRRLAQIQKVESEVTRRLRQEINHWDHRSNELHERELAGRPAKLSAENAQRRADALEDRLQARLTELAKERQLAALPPTLIAAALVVPTGRLKRLSGDVEVPDGLGEDRAEVERLAIEAVLAAERALGFEPADVGHLNLGYDIESRDPRMPGHLRLIEVKGRVSGADTVTVTRNEILTALTVPESWVLAIVEVAGGFAHPPRYVRRPFERGPDVGQVSATYALKDLYARAANGRHHPADVAWKEP